MEYMKLNNQKTDSLKKLNEQKKTDVLKPNMPKAILAKTPIDSDVQKDTKSIIKKPKWLVKKSKTAMPYDEIFDGFKHTYLNLKNVKKQPHILSRAYANKDSKGKKKHWYNSVKHVHKRNTNVTSKWYGDDGILVWLLVGSKWFKHQKNPKQCACEFASIVQNAEREQKKIVTSNTSKKKFQNKNTLDKLRQTQKNKWKDPEFREKMDKARKTESYLQKRQQDMQERWQDPQYRSKINKVLQANGFFRSKEFDVINRIIDKKMRDMIRIDTKHNEWILCKINDHALMQKKLAKMMGFYLAVGYKENRIVILPDANYLKTNFPCLLRTIEKIYTNVETIQNEILRMDILQVQNGQNGEKEYKIRKV
jgi:hypothetical protein